MTCYLYRHFRADGVLLYVGISLCALTRLNQHRQSPWFKEISRVQIERHPTREYASFQEHCAVVKEKPIYNKVVPAYDCNSPTLIAICIENCRAEVWTDSWDPSKDHSSHEDALSICCELESETIAESCLSGCRTQTLRPTRC